MILIQFHLLAQCVKWISIMMNSLAKVIDTFKIYKMGLHFNNT